MTDRRAGLPSSAIGSDRDTGRQIGAGAANNLLAHGRRQRSHS